MHANNTIRKQLQRITMRYLQLIATTSFQTGRLSSSIFKHGEHFIHRERRFLASSGTMEAIGYFDAIDNAREILEDDKTLAEKVPSCVVVGMQSVGKSAVLSRISGIWFPQDSEVCTRVAIELRLRRSNNPSNLLTMKAGNHESKEIDKSNDAEIEQALEEAQKKVLQGRQFEDKMSVKIEKEDPNIPDVTLVDLPGVFFAKERVDDVLEEKVKSMISERVNNEMALILHVIPVDQDTDTVSTWRYVHEADKQQKRTISVLTKADLALKDGTDVLAKRIRKISADSKTSECFVVHGATECDIEEQLQLENVVSCIEGLELEQTINVGTVELSKYIQERMLDHIKDKVPEMRGMLEDQLRKSSDELKNIGRDPIEPVRIAIRDYDHINDHLDKGYQSFQPVLRDFVDNLTNAIFGIDMKPLGTVDTSKANKTLLHNFAKTSFDSVDKIPKKTREFHILALEVKKIGDDNKRMINTQFVGKETELKEWLTSFANPFEEVTTKFMDDVFDLFYDQVIQPSITNGLSEFTKKISKQLKLHLKKNLTEKAKRDAKVFSSYLSDSMKQSTYTTNDHYFTATEKDLRQTFETDFQGLGEAYKSDMEPFFQDVCKFRAFFKTRKKILPDTIQLIATKALDDLHKATKDEIKDLMMASTNIEKIKESKSLQKKREFHIYREKKIKSALEQISVL